MSRRMSRVLRRSTFWRRRGCRACGCQLDAQPYLVCSHCTNKVRAAPEDAANEHDGDDDDNDDGGGGGRRRNAHHHGGRTGKMGSFINSVVTSIAPVLYVWPATEPEKQPRSKG